MLRLTLPILALAQLLAFASAQEKPEPATTSAIAGKQTEKTKIQVLRPAGVYADLPEMGFDVTTLLTGGGSPPKGFFQLLEVFDELAKNQAATTVLLDLSREAHFNLPQLGELERAIQRLRAAGKKVVAYLESADTARYQIAAQADRVLLADMGVIDLRSPAMSVMFLKDALDLLGVQVEVSRVGEYKGAVEPFLLPQMSAHLRSHYEKMLASMNEDVVRRVGNGRKLTHDQVRALQAQRLFPAEQAKTAGLVDRVVPWEGASRALALELGNDAFELVDAQPPKSGRNRDVFAMFAEMFRGKKDAAIDEQQLVVLHLSGTIVDGEKAAPGSMVSGSSVKLIDQLTENELVKGVVVRINSPGGSATASEAIRRALERLAQKKPVVISMGDLAASGGYWITCIGRPIFAEPGTITGSIGVFSMRLQTGALMRRLGVHDELIALDESAEMDAMDRPWSDAARAKIQGFIDQVYARFLGNVAASRKLDVKAVDAIAGGRVWSGSQALELKLVDHLGGLDAALAEVRKGANVGADIEVNHLPRPRTFADAFVESMFEGQAFSGERAAIGVLLQKLGRVDSVLALLREAVTGDGQPKAWALMPGVLRIR